MGELEIGHPVAEEFSLNGAVLSRFASRHNDGFTITLWLIIGDTIERFVSAKRNTAMISFNRLLEINIVR